MTHFTVCCGFASHYHNIVTGENQSRYPRRVCAGKGHRASRLLALAAAYDGMSRREAAKVGGMDRQTLDDPHWKSVDQAGQTFVEAMAEGMDADPWGDTAIPVPDRFTENQRLPVRRAPAGKGAALMLPFANARHAPTRSAAVAATAHAVGIEVTGGTPVENIRIRVFEDFIEAEDAIAPVTIGMRDWAHTGQ